tara:strand:+ start:385 stop:978 length:594 start_codon:yes stop_codon:yes gene_type:complete
MKQDPEHRKSFSALILWIVAAVLAGLLIYMKVELTKLNREIGSLRGEITAIHEGQDDSSHRSFKSDASNSMRAICTLADFAGGESNSGGQQLTMRLAEEELLHFVKVYVKPSGEPMAKYLLTSDEEWHISVNKESKYHSAMEAVSIAVERAKTSIHPRIDPDGMTRHLLEHIHRWLTKKSEQGVADQRPAAVDSKSE